MGTQTYEVQLAAGEFLRFSVKVRGLFGTVTVEDPSGTRITQRRSESNEIVAHPRVEFVAEASGVHRIRIETVGWQATGTYVAGNHNRQFVLNVLHWLSRVLP